MNLRESNHEQVAAGRSLDDITIDAPNYPQASAGVWLKNTVYGASVTVYINGRYRASDDVDEITTGWPFMLVGETKDDDVITARQSLCGKNGALSPPQRVQWGHMTLTADPSTLIREQRQSLLIEANDNLTGNRIGVVPVAGPPSGANVGFVGIPIAITPSATQPSPAHFVVNLQGFQPGVLDVPLVVKPPPPLGNLTIELLVGVVPPGSEVITKVDWALLGAGHQLVKSDSPNASVSKATISVPSPAGGIDAYHLSGTAALAWTDPVTQNHQTGTATAFIQMDGQGGYKQAGSIEVDWRGQSLTVKIRALWYLGAVYLSLDTITPS